MYASVKTSEILRLGSIFSFLYECVLSLQERAVAGAKSGRRWAENTLVTQTQTIGTAMPSNTVSLCLLLSIA